LRLGLARPPSPPTPPPATTSRTGPTRTSGLALASAICSIGSFLILPLGFIPGIICGHLAKRRIAENRLLTGAGLAKTGLIAGYIALSLHLLVLIGFLGLAIFAGGKVAGEAKSALKQMAQQQGAGGGAMTPTASLPGRLSPAETAPVSAKTLGFAPKTAGQVGRVTYLFENRTSQPVTRIQVNVEYRDADEVLEKSVPYISELTLPPHAKTEQEHGDFFMSEMTRGVTLQVKEVEFADGSSWTPFAAAAPGPLSFAGHSAPANAEVIRFRPNQAGKGSVAFRVINHSNKAINEFELEATYLDAAGKVVKALRPETGKLEDIVPHSQSLGNGMEIPPGGKYESDPFFNPFQADQISDQARSVRIAVRALTFAGGEKWETTKK